MAFTDVEMAILSRLAYYGSRSDVQKQPAGGTSLHSVLTDPNINAYLREQLGSNYDSALRGLIDKTKGVDYEIVKAVDDNKGTGFAAIAIKDPQNTVTVAARGTEGFNIFASDASRRDVDADLELLYSTATKQQKAMGKFMQALEKENFDGYYFTGHSLGGNLANYGAIVSVPADKVKSVTTFNAPGFNEAFILIHKKEIAVLHDCITNFQNEYDCVSSIMHVPGNITIVESVEEEGVLGFRNHFLDGLAVAGNTFKQQKGQKKSYQAKSIHILGQIARIASGLGGVSLFCGIVEMGMLFGKKALVGYEKVAPYLQSLCTNKSGAVGETTTDFSSDPEKISTGTKKFSILQMAIFAGVLIWQGVNYLIAAPSGIVQIGLWVISTAIPFVLIVMLLRTKTAMQKLFRSKVGGILMLVLFVLLLLLIQLLYFWLSIAFFVGGTFFLIKCFTDIMPNIYTARLENADGTTTTETHILGNNPDQDIKAIDSDYESKGYTKK